MLREFSATVTVHVTGLALAMKLGHRWKELHCRGLSVKHVENVKVLVQSFRAESQR